jgi:aryl-alcohol dehydrogenase-like predicted oxidoreductase
VINGDSILEYKELGKSGIRVSAIGLGAWQWGSREWGWNKSYTKKDVLAAFQKALEVGINFIDTAEFYGRGMSEQLISEAIHERREEVVVASKVSPWNLSYSRVVKAAERSLRRLHVDTIDLYQVHWPNPLIPIRRTMEAMKRLVESGKVRCVGVSNFNVDRTKSAQEALAPLELASNQVKYNLLQRRIETELLPYTKEAKISIIAYSPLAQGLLSGKYAPNSRPTSFVQQANSGFSSRNLEQIAQLNQVLADIASAHGKTLPQAALNWLISKENVIAIPGSKKPENVIDDAGATGWRMNETENQRLDDAVTHLKLSRLSGLPNLIKALAALG